MVPENVVSSLKAERKERKGCCRLGYKVLVLAGGRPGEREVSLRSGRR